MPSTLSECFELLVEAEQLRPRLDAAATALAQIPDLVAEQAWLAAARERLASLGAVSYGDLLDRSVRLPELESLKGERGKLLAIAVADAYDRFHAEILLAGTARSPLLEIVLAGVKIPTLRKCTKAEVERFCVELDKRLTSSYAKRVLSTDRYHAVRAALSDFWNVVATWRAVFVDAPLDGEAAAAVRDELSTAARAVELPVRQARLLAQAALLPAQELLDAAGVLTAKGKARGKDRDADTHAMLDKDPPDPLSPNADEQAEIAALRTQVA